MKQKQQQSHHQSSQQQRSSQSSFQPLCSCGNRSCEVMDIVRLLAETTDNFLVLQSEVQTLRQSLIPLLNQMHQDQQKSLERWQIELDIYRSQMASTVRPTMRWQQTTAEEDAFSRKQRWMMEWYSQEQRHLKAWIEQREQAMQAHEAHMQECALRFVQQALRPACVPAMAAVVEEHLERLHARLSRISQQAEAQASQIAELQTQYQVEVKRLQAGLQGAETQLAFGQRQATTQWVVKNLFGLGTPQSLTLTHQVYGQLKATQQLQAHVRLQVHFFWYCEQVWHLCEHSGLAAKGQVLTARLHHWQTFWHAFGATPSPDPNTILLGLVAPH